MCCAFDINGQLQWLSYGFFLPLEQEVIFGEVGAQDG